MNRILASALYQYSMGVGVECRVRFTNIYPLTFQLIIDLRKEARYLENEIDVKLVSYSKAGANATFSVISEV